MKTYRFKTQPFSHQKRLLDETLYDTYFGVRCEQGACKTKPMIDNAGILYSVGKVDGMLITAPKGVHLNWITDEIPKHLSEDVGEPLIYVWNTQKYSSTFKAKKAWEQLLRNKDQFLIVATNYDAFRSKKTLEQMMRLLLGRKMFWIVDESHNLGPDAKRTKNINGMSGHAKYRRFLTGTMIGNTAFNTYPQLQFLNPSLVPKTLQIFKHQYGIFEQVKLPAITTKTGRKVQPKFEKLVRYKNLDQLKTLIGKHTDRVLKDEVMDLPPKLFQKRYVELSKVQRDAYEELKREYYLELEKGLVTAEMAMTRLVRFQQIVCGYVKDDADVMHTLIPTALNPRLQAALEIIKEGGVKTIIWARYTQDINQIMHMLKENEIPAVRYDGSTSDEQKIKARVSFQADEPGTYTVGTAGYKKKIKVDVVPMVFVGNQEAGSEGVTLHAAKTMIFYSNLFKLIKRQQAEDRAHRAGLKHPVLYVDLVSEDTVDVQIIESLRSNKEIADFLNGDTLKEWI